MREIRSAMVGGVLVLMGVALGAVLFRSEPAGAQSTGYRECVLGRQETHDIDAEGQWERAEMEFRGNKIVRIPRGWEVVGSGGDAGLGVILICRR
ncbi:hypothetical protein [Sandaracinus amylolyticus]|uniref:hypothetical protein n=1 Tax=Sandaracinus amylolyticus TaxID=927083 RepID=UPI001F1E883D|nr:hypothetical protein [Sandaracinus amylolyticus]UJR79110.1 Hypothetical protein I5071_11430 [Sandaracinus amylolyticus]